MMFRVFFYNENAFQDEKASAHPFEDILVVVDEIKSVELTEIRPTTVPT